jgi:hypothetical protein
VAIKPLPGRYARRSPANGFDITTASELQPDTLAERLLDELRSTQGIVISPPMIGAWARLPE